MPAAMMCTWSVSDIRTSFCVNSNLLTTVSRRALSKLYILDSKYFFGAFRPIFRRILPARDSESTFSDAVSDAAQLEKGIANARVRFGSDCRMPGHFVECQQFLVVFGSTLG